MVVVTQGFTDEKAEAQRGSVTRAGRHSCQVWAGNPGGLAPALHATAPPSAPLVPTATKRAERLPARQ